MKFPWLLPGQSTVSIAFSSRLFQARAPSEIGVLRARLKDGRHRKVILLATPGIAIGRIAGTFGSHPHAVAGVLEARLMAGRQNDVGARLIAWRVARRLGRQGR